jgi:hypothetical protein
MSKIVLLLMRSLKLRERIEILEFIASVIEKVMENSKPKLKRSRGR